MSEPLEYRRPERPPPPPWFYPVMIGCGCVVVGCGLLGLAIVRWPEFFFGRP